MKYYKYYEQLRKERLIKWENLQRKDQDDIARLKFKERPYYRFGVYDRLVSSFVKEKLMAQQDKIFEQNMKELSAKQEAERLERQRINEALKTCKTRKVETLAGQQENYFNKFRSQKTEVLDLIKKKIQKNIEAVYKQKEINKKDKKEKD